jgi:hypothetical protein
MEVRAGTAAQVVEHLPMVGGPDINKKKKKKKGKEMEMRSLLHGH